MDQNRTFSAAPISFWMMLKSFSLVSLWVRRLAGPFLVLLIRARKRKVLTVSMKAWEVAGNLGKMILNHLAHFDFEIHTLEPSQTPSKFTPLCSGLNI